MNLQSMLGRARLSLAVERPLIRAVDGSGELAVPAYELFSATEILGRMAMDRMLAGLSTRRYPLGLEPVGACTEQTATSTSKSAVSRRFVAETETALVELLAVDLSGLDLVAMMVDGVHFGEHTCMAALGIGIDGTRHPLSLVEGSTGNATLVRDLLVGLREHGLNVTARSCWYSTGRRRCAARCSADANSTRSATYKIGYRSGCARPSRPRCAAPTTPTPYSPPRPSCSALAAKLDRTHPGAAISLREG